MRALWYVNSPIRCVTEFPLNSTVPGGFTVLSTKAISTLLTTEGYKMFGERITYPLLLVCDCRASRRRVFAQEIPRRFLLPPESAKFVISTAHSCGSIQRYAGTGCCPLLLLNHRYV